jgi:hypothetical protein
MKNRMVLVVILILPCFIVSAFSQNFPGRDREFNKLAQSTMTFLNIDVGARAVGMGGAFTCMDNDVSALFWNPAGAAKVKGGIVSLHHTQWIAEMKQYALAAALGTQNYGVFGLSFLIMDNGSIDRTIPDPTQPYGFSLDGTYQVNQWAVGLCYGKQLTDKFSIGGQVKYAFQDLSDAMIAISAEDTVGRNVENKEGTIAFDFGTLYYFGFKDLRIGMSIRNFSRPIKYSYESFNLPIIFKVGIAMNVISLMPEMGDHTFQLCLETVHPYDQKERIQLGGEYKFKDLFAVRLGYRSSTDVGALSAGFGLKPAAFGGVNLILDYAFSDAGKVLGSIHRFSFGFTF